MTEREINVTVAEACPGRFKFIDGAWWFNSEAGGEFWLLCLDGSICHDLNAMNNAELVLFDPTKHKPWGGFAYLDRIREVVTRGRDDLTPNEILVLMVRATAPQRAEAFLRTVGKWKD